MTSIAGIGTALPSNSIPQHEIAELVKSLCCQNSDQERLMPVLYRRTGVKSRHSVLFHPSNGSIKNRQTFFPSASDVNDRGPTTSDRMKRYSAEAAPLALAAAQRAFETADVPPDQISHLVTVSCSGFCAPGVDIALIRDLPLNSDVARTHIGFMGCHGALNGLRVARAFTEADPSAKVLLCAVELCSLHQQYGWNPEQVVANALFADGAAALVLVGSDAPNSDWRVRANGATVLDDSEGMMAWRIGDHGFEMNLSPSIPDLIEQRLRPWLDAWLQKHDLDVSRIASWAIHPGGPRILSAVGRTIGLSTDRMCHSHDVLAEYGNMSSPTILFILDRLQRANAARPCVAMGFGPGFAIEAVLFD